MVHVLTNLSNILIPLFLFLIVATGVNRKVNVYEAFIEGAKKGMHTVVSILPTLTGLMISVEILRTSGFLDFLGGLVSVFLSHTNFPGEIIPLIFVRLFSSSAATGLALDLFKKYGTDSYIGKTVSIIMSCTETCFYTMSVYYMAAKVKRTRWTLFGALTATLAGVIASVILARLM